MIKKFSKFINKIISKPIEEEKIECSIDEDVVDCKGDEFAKEDYTGVPAPVYLEHDPWFGNEAPPYSEKQIDYMEKETAMKIEEEKLRKAEGGEPENIHQLMYELATKNQNTTVQLNPPGGSENFQSGPGGWNSGTGQYQFRR